MSSAQSLQASLLPLGFFFLAALGVNQRSAQFEEVQLEEPTPVTWQLSDSGVAGVLDERGDALDRCRQARPAREELLLTVVVDATQGYGRVSEVRLPGAQGEDAPLSRCLLAVFDDIRFQSPAQGRAELTSRLQ